MEEHRYRVAMTRDDVETAYRVISLRRGDDVAEVCAVTRAINRAGVGANDVAVYQEYWCRRGYKRVRSLPAKARRAVNVFDACLQVRAPVETQVEAFFREWGEEELPVFEVRDQPAKYLLEEEDEGCWIEVAYHDDLDECINEATSLMNPARIRNAVTKEIVEAYSNAEC